MNTKKAVEKVASKDEKKPLKAPMNGHSAIREEAEKTLYGNTDTHAHDTVDQTMATLRIMGYVDDALNHSTPTVFMRIIHRAMKHKSEGIAKDPRIQKKKKLMKHLKKLNRIIRDAANDMEQVEHKIASLVQSK